MSLDIDGFALLAAIGGRRDVFADLAPEIDKAARAILAKHLKKKSFDVAALRALGAAIGAETLALTLDSLSEADISALLSKCDKHNDDAKAADDGWRRSRLNALAAGEAEPAPASKSKSAKLKPAPKRKAAEAGPGLTYASAGRVRKPAR